MTQTNTEVAVVGRISIGAGTVTAIVLMVAALWAWQAGPHLAFDANQPDVALWAVRSAAVAAGALAQALAVVLVLGNLYRRRRLDAAVGLTAAAIFAVALVSAVALGLAGR
jgi:hypothetical protein